MPTRIRRVGWAGQPPHGARAAAALSASLTWLSTGLHQTNAATGAHIPATRTSGARWVVSGPGGLAVAHDGASSVNFAGNLSWRADWTVMIVASVEATAVIRPCFGQSGTDGASLLAFNTSDQFDTVGATGRLSITTLLTGVNRSHAFVASAADGRLRNYVMRKSGSVISAWIDGAPQTVTTSGGFGGSHGAATDTIRVAGDSTDGARAWSGASLLYAIGRFATALPEALCISLSRNPWQLFEPRRIFVPVSSGTLIHTLSAPTYVPGSITSTGLTARVTVTAA